MKNYTLIFCMALSIFIFKNANAQLPSTITGDITSPGYGPIKLGNNTVKLYSQITNWHLADSTSTDTLGQYAFYNVTAGNYIIKATANAVNYPLAATTYFGDTTHWEDATILTVLPNTVATANINMKKLTVLTGNATLSGTLTEGNGYDRTAGIPISDTPIGLDHWPPDPAETIAHTTTDANGDYEFKNVPPGNYKVYVNVTGLPMANTYHLTTTPFDTVRNLDFVADSVKIDTVVANPNAVLSIASADLKMSVYPNPFSGFTTIEFTVPSANLVQMNVYNLLGEKVATLANERKQAGVVKYNFNTADKALNAGIYLLKLQIGNQTHTLKMIQTGQ